MVSNSLGMELQELLEMIERWRGEYDDDPQYVELRDGLPDDWPL